MQNRLFLRDAEGGPWYAHPGQLLPDGTVDHSPPDPATARHVSPTFLVGVDLGQVADFTALVVVEAYRLNAGTKEEPRYHYEISHLERHRGIAYPEVVQRVVALCAGLPAPPALIVDETGVGRAVCDQLRQANPRVSWFLPTTITSGADAAPQPDGSFHVAKRLLVGATQVALQNGRLKVGRKLPLASTLIKEMLSFRAKISASGNVTYGAPETSDWRLGVHDDLLLATALAVWASPYADGVRHNRWVL